MRVRPWPRDIDELRGVAGCSNLGVEVCAALNVRALVNDHDARLYSGFGEEVELLRHLANLRVIIVDALRAIVGVVAVVAEVEAELEAAQGPINSVAEIIAAGCRAAMQAPNEDRR